MGEESGLLYDLRMASKFGWCNDGDHEGCWRHVTGISGVHAGTTRHCGCTQPGCPCATYNEENPSEDPA